MFNGSQIKLANALDKQPSIITRTLNTSASGARGIGNSFAREIESKLELEQYWLDQTHQSTLNKPELSLVSNLSNPLEHALDLEITMWVFKVMDELLGEDVRRREGEQWWSLTFIYLYDMALSDKHVMDLSEKALLRMVTK